MTQIDGGFRRITRHQAFKSAAALDSCWKAGAYLSMNRTASTPVRPHLTEIPIGQRGIAFDRLELDAWADQYGPQRPFRP